MVPGRKSSIKNSIEHSLNKKADKNLERFEKAIEYLGGKVGGDVGSGGKSWIIPALPRIPVQLLYYYGDCEFSSEVRLLFDKSSTNYLEFEFLAVFALLLTEAIINRSK